MPPTMDGGLLRWEDRIEVRIIRARNLVTSGGMCNPFVRVRCAGETASTKTLPRTTDPEWNAESMIFYRINDCETDHILAEVYSKNNSTGCFLVIITGNSNHALP